MELRETLSRKPVKFLTLLLTALLIATASAAVYYSLSMTATINVAGTEVWFEVGSDNGTACTVLLNPQKTVATITGLKAYPNTTQTYEDPIEVHNNSTTQTYQVRLRPVSLSGNDTEFVFVKFTVNASAGSQVLQYDCNGTAWSIPSTTGWVTLGISEDAPIIIETKAKGNAATPASVSIEIAVDVK